MMDRCIHPDVRNGPSSCCGPSHSLRQASRAPPAGQSRSPGRPVPLRSPAGAAPAAGGPWAPGICGRMPDLIDLTGRVVIVTGGSSGIGASTARLLHAAGAHPVLAARRADRLAALSEELDGALAVPTDVTDAAQVRQLGATALDRHRRVGGRGKNAG